MRRMPSARTLPGIQGLRALAIVLVVLYHAQIPLPGGFVGVDVFFVISGFVITRMMLGNAARGELGLAQFFVRRARRLLPALGLMIVVVLAASSVVLSPLWAMPITIKTAKWASVGAANFGVLRAHVNYFSPTAYDPLIHTWSLGIEEQFYAVFGLLVAICWWWTKRSGRRMAVAVGLVCVLVLVGSLAVCLVASRQPPPLLGGNWAFYNPLPRAWEFALGGLLAATLPRLLTNGYLAGAGLAAVVFAAFWVDAGPSYPGWTTLIPTLGTAALLVGAIEHPGLLGQALRSRPAQWIGDRSYAWYLWHWPAIELTKAAGGGRAEVAAAGVASLGIAAVTYAFWEDPIRRRNLRLPHAVVVPALSVAVALGASFGSEALNRHLNTGPIGAMSVQVGGYGFRATECTLLVPIPQRDLQPCIFAGDGPKRPVIVMGDSNAAQFNGGIVKADQQLRRTTTLVSSMSCGLIDLGTDPAGTCIGLTRAALAWLAKQPPSIVIVGNVGTIVDDPARPIVDPTTGRVATDPRDKADVWAAAMKRTYAAIAAMHHVVVHVDAIPHFASPGSEWEPTDCAFLALHRDPQRCGESASASTLLARWPRNASAQTRGTRDVRRLDLTNAICPAGACATNIGNRWIYRDGLHLSERESDALAPAFVRLLRGLP